MPPTRLKLPEVWPSAIAKLIAGESSCVWAHWYKSNHRRIEKVPSDFNSAEWNANHTALIQQTVARLEKDGWSNIRLENQNRFRLTGARAAICGKPDIVAQKQGAIKVIDCKSGAERASHIVQVCVYLNAIPRVWNRPGLFVTGEVVYPGQVSIDVEREQAAHFWPKIVDAVKQMASADAPGRTPSQQECSWCEIAGCSDRVDTGEVAEAAVGDF